MNIISSIKTLWDFSRPHTIIGSTVSILVLYLIANDGNDFMSNANIFFLTWISALGCNVFITGFNQLYDIEIDKINKPFLPLADGRLSVRSAWKIVIVALIVCVSVSAFLDIRLLGIMILILLIGAFYSLPSIRLKTHHISAALSIVAVRGIVVNLGIGFWMELVIRDSIDGTSLVIPLTIVITAFSFVIAWFKDLNDMAGDKEHDIKTLALLYDKNFAVKLGSVLVFGSLIGSILLISQYEFLIISHIALIIGYTIHLLLADFRTTNGLYQFYLKFWIFFAAVYLMFGLQTMLN